MIELDLHPSAKAELSEAVDFYEAQAAGLGANFLRAVEATFRRIASLPDAGSPLRRVYRRQFVYRFPYSVIYRPDRQPLRVLAIMHHRRRPDYWLRRR